MHGSLIFLATSFAASVTAAPVPISPASPVEAAEPLMVREANVQAISPVLNNIKREILERLDTIIQRAAPELDSTDVNPNPVQAGASGKPEAEGSVGSAYINGKREWPSHNDGDLDLVDKRQPLHSEESNILATEKRQPLHGEESNTLATEKRQPLHSEESNILATEKRQPLHSEESNTLATEKRQLN